MVSHLPEQIERVQADRIAGKLPPALQRWRNERVRATRLLLDSLDRDKPLADLTRVDIMQLRDRLIARAKTGEIQFGTASRDLTILLAGIRAVSKAFDFGLRVDDITIEARKGEKNIRKPIPTDWLRDKLLARGALNRLNISQRLIVLICVNTGARPSEVRDLAVRDIELDGNIPMLNIHPALHDLKTESSERRIPLVGVSLEAAREALALATADRRAGKDWLFPTYVGKDISANVNKYLRKHDLVPSGCTLYGLRHAFEDRLDAAGIQQRVKDDLMGHVHAGERYGDGGGDATRLAAVEKIAL